MLRPSDDYDSLVKGFSWEIPARFNIGRAVAERPQADALALIEVSANGERRHWRFADVLERHSNQTQAM